MARGLRLWMIALALAVASVFCARWIGRSFRYPYPPFNQMVFDVGRAFETKVSFERPLASDGGFRDLAGPLFGLRRLTADLAWISILQYYGAHERSEQEDGHAHHDFGGGEYPALQKMTLRVLRLDPSMHYAALYGAGALAFNLNRPDQALEILQEAVASDPTYWKYRLYVGAIVYKQKGKFDDMIGLLEDAARFPDCPTMVKSILANIYEERGQNAKAIAVWLGVLDDPKADDWYRFQAERQIADLRKKIGI
jgi:tetratricopeptide (TPR) repeat protein